ncbi:MAG: GNAT family N-acetyltransferase, partial [Candidatus Asgardarchaeia archaeon]
AYYEKELLASLATSTEFLDSVALIREVYTHPSFRNKGLATSVCSAISKELLSLSKEVILWVAKDNLPAIRVYEKIGFKKTKYILLGFKARRRRK